MKKALLIAFLLMSISALGAEKKFNYTDAKDLVVLGKITPDTFEPFSRLPESLKEKTRKPVWNLGRNSAGICVRFSSDAGEFSAKWSILGGELGDNMSYILKTGLALYVLDGGEWVYVSTFRPRRPGAGNKDKKSDIQCTKLAGSSHEYMVYLGMYDGITSLEIGVPDGYRIEQPKVDSPKSEKPVIAYGTSILQGASASHPGLAGTNLLGRMLDRVVINLGFSGNALLDTEIAEYMASYPTPGAYIIDNAPNGSAKLTLKKGEEFYRIIRKAHPDTPIFFVEMPRYPKVRYDELGAKNFTERRDAIDEVFNRLKKSGEKNIYLVKSDKMLLDDNIGTIEGTHFTDIGFQKWADAVYKVMKGKIK